MSSNPSAYNGVGATGGDSATQDLNVWYSVGDFAWIMTSSALVLLMVPGVGFFYSGLARRKSALALIWLCLMSIAVAGFQWFFWGYSLTFSHSGASGFVGDLANIGLRDVLGRASVGSNKVPDLLFCLFQGMFAAITPAIAIGAAADRGRMLPCVVFIFVWSTLVYDPIAYWAWNPHGWSYVLGGLDFAGGTPVHISSGAAALAYSLVVGRRAGYVKTNGLPYRPHNVTHVVLGTVFLWVGWFGFNGGSALGANLRAVMACIVTHIAACVGGLTWCALDYRLDGKWSTVGFCSGVISGLVAITPASGFVAPWAAVVFGLVGGIGCNLATNVKFLVGVDDALDIFAVHGVGGILGNLLTGLFAADYIAFLDGSTVIPGGWVTHHWIQLAYQLADSVSGFAYSFVVTCLILYLMNFVPGLSLRVSAEQEELGLDEGQLGEFAYDYVELSRHVSDVMHAESLRSAGRSPVRSKTDSGKGSLGGEGLIREDAV